MLTDLGVSGVGREGAPDKASKRGFQARKGLALVRKVQVGSLGNIGLP